MTDLYAVVGNPVEHSKSPLIHGEFARQTGQDMRYEKRLAPRDGFVAAVEAFRRQGGKGMNVTVPFKIEAFRYASRLTERAEYAGAVNTLKFDGDAVLGDNTDGAGLVHDLESNLGCSIAGSRVLLLGAGGAARGAIPALAERRPRAIVIANRTPDRACALAETYQPLCDLRGGDYQALADQSFDLVINATSAGLDNQLPPLPASAFAGAAVYDMVYGPAATAFLAAARAGGARLVADGLGMLVEQAVESFFLWRGVRPRGAPVIALLRSVTA